VISHGLRTPITTIYGPPMLRQRSPTLDGAVVSKALEDIEGEADRLQPLVEDLLVLSRQTRQGRGRRRAIGSALIRRVAETGGSGPDGRSTSRPRPACRWPSARRRTSSR
jgi:signal transduction histidine kinase